MVKSIASLLAYHNFSFSISCQLFLSLLTFSSTWFKSILNLYLYLASVGRMPLGTGRIVPTSVSRAVSNASFGSGSEGRPTGSDGACSWSVDKTSMNLSLCKLWMC
jgi:hypothetical protein